MDYGVISASESYAVRVHNNIMNHIVPQYDDEPRYVKRAVKRKRYGIEQWSGRFNEWCFARWYATEKARDVAYNDLCKPRQIFFFNKGWCKLLPEVKYRKVDR